ncbi:chloride transporter, ClC family [Teladorsagia circumcincta]|uniref:Chloride channel protein n=1 Tax=Teladorsagia circumcincta TaxID=45464 RepID=A0A2G9V5M5_TELCI|nr:chloride transporter, ClC family [Teladorsagia circumcincta]
MNFGLMVRRSQAMAQVIGMTSSGQPIILHIPRDKAMEGCAEIMPYNRTELEFCCAQFLLFSSEDNDNRSEDSIVVPPMQSKMAGRTYFGCCCSPKRMYKVFKYAIEEWVFLALLGLIMAMFSLGMDIMISKLQEGHMAFYRHFKSDPIWVVSFFVWTLYVVILICASALCAHYIAPQAIGSGIPEMKTVLRGVILKEYLSVRTLISKMIGLTLSLGSGLPIGKEGPFVHIASVVANQLNRFLTRSTGVFQNESRANELLAAGCAVGVACTFTAPVGGVLFSIEVTAAYFAIRNYWRGFFAATCSATLFSVLRGIRKGAGNNSSAWTDLLEMSMEAHYQTNFTITDTYASSELMAFALMGWLLYPAFVSFFMTAVTYPLGTGKYLGGEFILSLIAATLPVPSGIFMPVFVLGGAFGRMIGEFLRLFYPSMVTAGFLRVVHPGVYAVVGAAAFCGAVTHTVSVAVIVFELTGQLVLLIPVMIAVLIANAVCSYLQPSIYDSIIKIKRLPYLPDISHSSSMYHSLSAEQFMTTPVAYVGKDSTYGEVQELILEMSHVRAFPLVENRKSMALLGSVTRSQLFKLIQSKVGVKARQAEATERIRRVIDDVSKRYRVTNEGKSANGKISGTTSPMGTKRFSITPAVEDEAEMNLKPYTKSENNFLTVPGISYGMSFPAVHPDDILAMGTKRTRSSTVGSQADPYHTIGGKSVTDTGPQG